MQNEKKFQESIKELREIIEESVKKIKKYNAENICVIHEEDFEIATELARKLIKEYNINLYYSLIKEPSSIFQLLKSENEEEFLSNLEEYARDIESFAELEEKSFYETEVRDNVDGSIEDIDNAEYIVKVYRIHPSFATAQISTIICCKSEDEARKVADKIRRANINVSIKQVDCDTRKEILTEYCEDMLRYYKNNHNIEHLQIMSAERIC
jgi:hypothetical protein